MSNTAPSINTFGSSPKGEDEPQLVTISLSDYKDIFIKIETLTTRITELEAHIHALEAHQLDDTARLARDIALDRQRLTKLERTEPKPLQKDRAEILRALIAANGGKILAKDARKKMRVPKSSFSELLKACNFVEKRPYHLDSRQDVLVLK